jgi:hypothetical protein
VSGSDADEILARPGRRHGAGAVVGIGAGSDDRRIADTAPTLAGGAAGRGSRSDMALGVESDRSDRAIFILDLERADLLRLHLVKLPTTLWSREIVIRNLRQPSLL